jgi:hypothetical protein
MDLTLAYPREIGLQAYTRTVTHHKGSSIVIQEHVKGSCSPVLSLMTVEQPLVEGSQIHLGKDALISLLGDFHSLEIEAIPITDARLLEVWPQQIHRILVGYHHALEITIT